MSFPYIYGDVRSMAEDQGWEPFTYQENIYMASFKKDDMRINVYLTTGTVATCLNHPKQGKTQMFRRKVDSKTLLKIFKNPRLHTNKGYQKK